MDLPGEGDFFSLEMCVFSVAKSRMLCLLVKCNIPRETKMLPRKVQQNIFGT
jgi:hypothetical protein